MHKRLALFIVFFICVHASTAFGIWNYERPDGNTSALRGCWSDDTVSYAVGDNGVAFRHKDSAWTGITGAALEGAHLFAVHGTPSGAVYAAGYRPGPPRFDTNGDGQINTDDTQSRHGVIFRYNGSTWEELNTGYEPESQFFASSFVGIWADDDSVIYFAGGKKLSGNNEAPTGVLLSYDGASFRPLAGTANGLPTINGIWGNPTHAYLACSSDTILKLNRSSSVLSFMKTGAYAVNYRGIHGDDDGTLYAVGQATYGYIFRYHATNGWEPMGIDRNDTPPIYCIAKHGALLVASGSYGKTYYLDREQNIWKEMLVGTQSHINCLSVAGNDLLGATDGGELYRMTEQTPNTAFILADPPTSIGTLVDGTLTSEVTLYDFSLGDIWKREWRFHNGNHHAPVPSYAALYSHTASGVSTALYITGEGGEESNRELRIAHCNGCPPHVDITNDTVTAYIQSGHTTQNALKELLENSTAVSDVYVRHGESPWVISGKEYDSAFLTGGREDEDLYINEATRGDSDYLAVHNYKDEGTFEPNLTVYRENIAFLGGAIKIMGRRTETKGPTISIVDAGATDLSSAAQGTLGNSIKITAKPGARGNICITLGNEPEASEISSVFMGSTLYVSIHSGVTSLGELITHLNDQEPISEAALSGTATVTQDDIWDMATMENTVILEGGENYVASAYAESNGSERITVTIDSGITTSRDIANAIFNTRTIHGDDTSDRLVKELELTTPEMVWKLEEHANETTLPGITTETASTTVRIVDPNALNFDHSPTEAKLQTTVAFNDTSDASLDIIKWEWHVFREVSTGYETKAAVESETGAAEVTVSDLGTYDIGMQVTLKDGSTLHMQKEEALAIKGKNAGDNSLGGASGCFIGSGSDG
ncbi:hypothetical protein DSLASN_09530 [Desulfoluna limicola]|uniref:Uncharacterized protein n=1 Tax=Desulfoluna limicola TaxID=2810562 RepID=A0ABN6F0B0_9BACT|nr:hypothetical protein [Desulfoluna limicola]BCS95321.1 hypothetical protein DSLASN_09530 [Desulfoluna limicola]